MIFFALSSFQLYVSFISIVYWSHSTNLYHLPIVRTMLCAYMPFSKRSFLYACLSLKYKKLVVVVCQLCVSVAKEEACCMPVCLCRKRSFSIINSHHDDPSHHRFPPKRTKWIGVLIS